jgi:tetratricopeptide (TPR) repeat protein
MGCTHETTQQFVNPPPSMPAEVKKEADLPKRMPKPTTCVAFGEFDEKAALEPNRSSADKERLLDQARRAYQQALELEPNYLPALKGLARVYIARNDEQRVVATFQQAIKLYPKDAGLVLELGMWHARRREWDAALIQLRTAHDLDPENRQCANMLGYCLARTGRFDESIAVFTKAGGEAQAHFNLARMLHHMQQDELSKQHAQLALQKDPQLKEAAQLLVELSAKVEEAPQPRVGTPNVMER